MSRRTIALAALAAAIVTAPAVAHAQGPLRFGLAAGATVPTGNFGDIVEWGYNVSGSITGKPMLSPVGIRGEVMWNRLTGKEIEGVLGTVERDDVDILAGIVNAEIGMSGIGVKPYLIGGLGIYRLSIAEEGSDVASESKLGFNIGAGLDFGLAGFSAFAEARFHTIQADNFGSGNVNVIPLTFGFRF